MAYIDKTYFNTIEQYKEICDWCHSQGTVTDDYENVITPAEYLPHKIEYDDEKEEFKHYMNIKFEYENKLYRVEIYIEEPAENTKAKNDKEKKYKQEEKEITFIKTTI